jgi:ketosteroid isomerase-like protein
MDSDNVALARTGYDVLAQYYRSGDPEPLRRHFEAALHPDCVLTADAEIFTEGEWRGHDGFLHFVMNQADVLDDMWIRPEDFVDVGDEWVVVPVEFGGRGRHTQMEVSSSVVHAYRMVGGRAAAMHVFPDMETALETIGLQRSSTDR